MWSCSAMKGWPYAVPQECGFSHPVRGNGRRHSRVFRQWRSRGLAPALLLRAHRKRSTLVELPEPSRPATHPTSAHCTDGVSAVTIRGSRHDEHQIDATEKQVLDVTLSHLRGFSGGVGGNSPAAAVAFTPRSLCGAAGNKALSHNKAAL